jgi:hypothetical protein
VAHRPYQKRANRSAKHDLRELLEQHAEDPSAESRCRLLECLREGNILLGLRELPRDLGADPDALGRELPVRFLTHEGAEGETLLAGFSDAAALSARAPAAVGLAIDTRAVLDWIFEAGLAGIALDPSGACACISRDDVLELLGLGDYKRSRGRALSMRDGPEPRVRDALARLLESDADPTRLVLKEPRTGRLLRFERSEGETLLLTVPAETLGRDEFARTRLLFDELAGLPEDESQTADRDLEPTDLQALFTSAEPAAQAAVKVFTWAFGFPSDFELEVSS